MTDRERLIEQLKRDICECEVDAAYWRKQQSLAEEKVALCKDAVDICERTIRKYREVIQEALSYYEDSD